MLFQHNGTNTYIYTGISRVTLPLITKVVTTSGCTSVTLYYTGLKNNLIFKTDIVISHHVHLSVMLYSLYMKMESRLL